MSSDLVSRDVPQYGPRPLGPTSTQDGGPGYWIELEIQARFSSFRERKAARGTNARFAEQDAQPFGSLPTGEADGDQDLLPDVEPAAVAS